MKSTIQNLKKESKLLSPTIQIGKNGITPTLITQINNQLKKNKLVKIKALRSAVSHKSMKRMIEEITTKTDSALVDSIGFTLTIYKP